MTIQTMREVDRLVGVPLCMMTGLLRKVLKKRTIRPPQEAERVLVIKFFGLGSILFATPALALIKKSLQHAKISFLSFEANQGLLERLPLIDEVLTINPSSTRRFLLGTLATIVHILTGRYDIVFDLEFFSKFSTVLTGLSGADHRVGFALPTMWRNLNLSHFVTIDKRNHVSHAFSNQVASLLNVAEVTGLLAPILRETDTISMLQKVNPNGKPLVVINVNAGETFLERRWSPDRFAQLVDRLGKNSPYDFYFIGNTSERTYVQAIIDATSSHSRCTNVAGLLTVPELSALLSRSQMLVSNDSGPLHLGSALGISTIGLFGPEDPAFYGPLGPKSQSIYKRISCSPCLNMYAAKAFHCPYDAKCMEQIDVDEVVMLADRIR